MDIIEEKFEYIIYYILWYWVNLVIVSIFYIVDINMNIFW